MAIFVWNLLDALQLAQTHRCRVDVLFAIFAERSRWYQTRTDRWARCARELFLPVEQGRSSNFIAAFFDPVSHLFQRRADGSHVRVAMRI